MKTAIHWRPPSSNLRGALLAVREQVERLAKDRPTPGAATAEEATERNPEAARASAGGPAGAVRNREEALRALLQTADFFKRTEPHSPIAYLLEQAVRWGKMPLPDLLTELIPEESQRSQLFKMLGIRLPEKHEP